MEILNTDDYTNVETFYEALASRYWPEELEKKQKESTKNSAVSRSLPS